MRVGTATALVGVACALTLAAPALPANAQPDPSSWSADLAGGETAGVRLDDGTASLDPDGAFLAAAEEAPTPDGAPRPTGLLTFPPRTLPTATNRVVAVIDGDIPAGTLATVAVRAQRTTGSWTEWVPASKEPGGLTVRLPAPATQVQSRLVLAGDPAAGPHVRGVRLTAYPAPADALAEGAEQGPPLSFRVFATREGLVGSTTANGHVIGPRDHFVALPSRRALAPRGAGDYSVKICASNGRCAFAPVWDVGPWNTRDDYWNPTPQRQQWDDLPQGLPQAQAAHLDGYNGGRDQYNRPVANPAGIDLGDGLFWDALGLRNNDWVTVEYLWTGASPLSRVTGVTSILSAPSAAAAVVGVVADGATVPVQCLTSQGDDRWLRIGVDQYLAAAAVPGLARVGACPRGAS